MKNEPLSELEMFELLQAAYPEKFPNDDNDTWDSVMDFADEFGGFDELAELLGRVAMLSMPMTSPLTGRARHCLGIVAIKDGQVYMKAAVTREVKDD